MTLKEILEKNVDIKYYIKQKSMIKAIEQNKIKILDLDRERDYSDNNNQGNALEQSRSSSYEITRK